MHVLPSMIRCFPADIDLICLLAGGYTRPGVISSMRIRNMSGDRPCLEKVDVFIDGKISLIQVENRLSGILGSRNVPEYPIYHINKCLHKGTPLLHLPIILKYQRMFMKQLLNVK